jgi:hypothetical protein
VIRRSRSIFSCLVALGLLAASRPDPAFAQKSDVPLPYPDPSSFVSASGGHFRVDNKPFIHVGVNEGDFIYERDQWSDTWSLRQGGVKQIRAGLANDAYTTAETIARLDSALGVAWSRGIRITVVLTNFYHGYHDGLDGRHGRTAVQGDDESNYYTNICCEPHPVHVLNQAWVGGGYRDHYKPFVQAVVDHFKSDPRVFAWEIGNEIPVRLGPQGLETEAAIAFYRDMAATIKGIDHNHMVSTGIICTEWMPLTTSDQKRRLYELMDYVVEHYYPDHPNGGALADDQLAALYTKPLVIEEYGVDQTAVAHDSIMPTVTDFFDWAHAAEPVKQADAVMVWGVDFPGDLGSDDPRYGPNGQNLVNDYLQLWRETADWARPSPRYSDVPPGDTFYSYIECLGNRRVIGGQFDWADDTHNDEFRPNSPLTRGQAMRAIVRAMGFTLPPIGAATFDDVPASNPYYRYVEAAYALGIIGGYPDHTFHPYEYLTRGQMSKVIVKAAIARYGWRIDTTGGPHFLDVPSTHTFYDYIETAYNRGVINGYPDHNFRPDNITTRGQFTKMLSQALSCSLAAD